MLLHLLAFANPQKVTAVTKKDIELLKASAEKMGHELEIIYDYECHFVFDGSEKLFVKNHDLSKIKVLIVRANLLGKNMLYRGAIIRQFEALGIPVVNKELAVQRAKNKLKQLQLLSRKGVPIPKTYVVWHAQYIDEVIAGIGSCPVILKSVSGSHGRGVSIVESKRALKSVIEMIIKDNDVEPLIVQEYVKEAKGKDVRVFIVGKKIVGAMERIATKKGEFRSNFHLGGRVRVAEMSEEEKRVAFAAIKACGLDFAGVDIIRTKTGPKVLEVNANPGLEGITLATGHDIAGAIIRQAVKRVKRKHYTRL